MESDLRAPLFSAAGAAVLSVLAGALAGVPFGVILLRAAIGGLAFGALVFGAGLLLRSFAPELLDPAAASPDAEAVDDIPPPGGRVDITLSDEEGPEPVLAASFAPIVGLHEAGTEAELEDLGPAEPPATFLESSDEDSPGAGSRGLPVNPVDGAAMAPHGTERGAMPSAGAGMDDLDVLPDLETLSDDFPDVGPFGGEGREGGGGAGEERGASRGGGGGGRRGDPGDPAILAQAVRTLLKRDQKG